MLRAREATTGLIVAERLRPAHTHWTRLKGLLGTRSLAPGEGLWIKPCRQVHMLGMRYAIDVVFLDQSGAVVQTVKGLAPNRISPKVKEAASVIELPVGTIDGTGLVRGSTIEIEGVVPGWEESRAAAVAALLGNVALAALFALFAVVHFGHARRTGQWATTMPLVVQEALLVVLFLTRRRSIATSRRPFDWAIGVTGAFLPLALRTTEMASLQFLGAPLQIAGLVVAIMGTAWLGRSIGVVAGNRGIKKFGPYRVVRHPMYAGYILSYVGYLVVYPTWRNLLIVCATFVALVARAIVEERFLKRDPAYRDYLRQVRWRVVPYLY